MLMLKWLNGKVHRPQFGALEILKYIGPGLLVTVGFIDPGNWASNVAAGSDFGYRLLWVVTLSTLMLIILQHNVAHLGIVTGLCLAEAANTHLRHWIGRVLLISAVCAAISTALAEILGASIGLTMLFPVLPLKLCVVLVLVCSLLMLLTNSYRKIERWIIAFVSLIGISFVIELSLLPNVPWGDVAVSTVLPRLPHGSIFLVMTVLGAVVMPHNLFLHSEVIQSRQWNLEDDAVIRKQLKFEFADTLISMIIGWAINSAMIVVAASTFFAARIHVVQLNQAEQTLRPLLGQNGNIAALVFALALLFAGLSSSITAGMAGGSIVAGLYSEPYDIKDSHTKTGVMLTLIGAAVVIFFINNPFYGLLVSQMLLSVQLPWTIFMQIYLTSSTAVMGKYANGLWTKITLWTVGLIVGGLNIWLFLSVF